MVTTIEIKTALRARYPSPEWALLFEVGDATGARHTRFADALAMSLWPSRGLTLHGMEIKISRSDWKRERAKPEKAETIAAYCDYWTLVTAKGVVADIDEIPPSWGWLEYHDGKFARRKDDVRTDASPVNRAFLGALLRRADKTNEALIEAGIAAKLADFDHVLDARVEQAVKLRAERNSEALDMVEKFEAESGIKFDRWYGNHAPAVVGRALKAVLASGVDRPYHGLFELSDRLNEARLKIETAMSEAGFERPPKTKGRR